MSEMQDNDPNRTELELADVLDHYRQQLHRGEDPDPEACLGSNPEFAVDLAECLRGLAVMEELRDALNAARPHGQDALKTLGDFGIVREIGRGGMGVVYEAIQSRLNRRVALKMIKAGVLAEGREREMFRKEALAAASLQHANIVQVFEFGEHEGQPYLVLEYVEGGNLGGKIAGTPIDPWEAAQLVATVARAIHYAHERGIVHCDLKPANVLLAFNIEAVSRPESLSCAQNPFAAPKVADFGLAKQLCANEGQTQSGVIKGTPSYMAPEQATGGIASPATDVYSLGAMLYETLTGRPPFKAATPWDTLLQVTSMEPVPPSRLQPDLPRDLELICLKCLHKEPSRRFQSAHDLAEDLGRFLRHEPTHTRPTGFSERVWRWCRRNPVVASLLSLATALACLVCVLLLLRFLDEKASRERILAENVFAANHLANTILVELWKSAEAVDQVANDPVLVKSLKEDRARMRAMPASKDPASPRFELPDKQRRLQEFLEKTHKEGDFAFHSWHAVDGEGILLADVPQPEKSVFGVSFQGRDYFVGAMRHVGSIGRARVHVSRVYQSANDDLFKITLSAIVYDDADHKKPIGVVCATLPTNASLGFLDLKDPEHTAVLVGRVDPSDPHQPPGPDNEPSKYMILVHPAYGELPEWGQGRKAVVVPHEMLPLIPHRRSEHKDEFAPVARSVIDVAKARHAAYEDPLGIAYPEKYAGRWLAGFAQVGNTEMIVIVQRRRTSWADASQVGLLVLGGLLALGLVFFALWQRRHRSRRGGAAMLSSNQAPTEVFPKANGSPMLQ